MNQCNQKFLQDNQIHLDPKDDYIFIMDDLNPILSEYGAFRGKESREVCISDIVGFDRTFRSIPSKLTEALDYFFDENGDTYHNRSLGLLALQEDDVMDKLRESFKYDHIGTQHLGDGKYLISVNGLHRFMVMRILYLNAKRKCQTPEELDELNKKFTLPIDTEELDTFITYAKYLLDIFQPCKVMNTEIDSEISNTHDGKREYRIMIRGYMTRREHVVSEEEYEEILSCITFLTPEYKDGKFTDNVKVSYPDSNVVITRDVLLDILRQTIASSFDKEKKIDDFRLLKLYGEQQSFRNFVDTYLKDVLDLDKIADRNAKKAIG